jgi:hypothetical protein
MTSMPTDMAIILAVQASRPYRIAKWTLITLAVAAALGAML